MYRKGDRQEDIKGEQFERRSRSRIKKSLFQTPAVRPRLLEIFWRKVKSNFSLAIDGGKI